ncbi:MAG: acetate kinase [Bacilli bacterium]|nr:acetate kinase [Bacilli bacterium]
MKIMSINAGSSSLKFSLFDMNTKEVIASGYFERVGIPNSFYTIKYNGDKIREEVEMPNHTVAVEVMLEKLIALNIIDSLDEIDGVGHRVVHGSDKYNRSVVITDDIIEDIRKFSDFAPLHNPANVLGIEAIKKALPEVKMVAVFDTAFHQTMEKVNYLYPVPYEWYTNYGVRKFGFHGTSHAYITKKISEILGTEDLKAIICHIGSGASISAVKNGKCVNTTMGFTPLAGVMMGTRSGDIDPSIIPYIMEKEGLNASEVIDILNKKSGLLGMSQLSSDCRDIENAINENNEQAKITLEKYVRTIVNYISSYYVELEGADVICLTAGVGENAVLVRKMIVDKLACLGITLDEEKNNVRGEIREISKKDSKVKVYVVPTDEELMIAENTLSLIK